MDELGWSGDNGKRFTAPTKNLSAVPVHNPSRTDQDFKFPVTIYRKMPQTDTIKECRTMEVQLHALAV